MSAFLSLAQPTHLKRINTVVAGRPDLPEKESLVDPREIAFVDQTHNPDILLIILKGGERFLVRNRPETLLLLGWAEPVTIHVRTPTDG